MSVGSVIRENQNKKDTEYAKMIDSQTWMRVT